MENNQLEKTNELKPILPMAESNDDILAIAEKRVETFNRIKQTALRATKSQDWVDMDGKPYLTGSGAEKIARLFGISWQKMGEPTKVTSHDDRGDFYYYRVDLRLFTRAGDEIEAVGTCSSRDPFFSKARGAWKPLSEVDETDIIKKSYTNALGNGITRILGIRNLSWDEVEAGVGFKRSQAAQVRHEQNPATASQENETRKKLSDILETLHPMDSVAQRRILEGLTRFTANDGTVVAGISDQNRLSGRRLEVTYGKAKALVESKNGK